MNLYFASVLPGLEHVLADEITYKVSDADIVQIKRGKVFFTSAQTITCFLTLRSADNLFQLLDQFQIGPHKKHLAEIVERMSQVDLDFMNKKKAFRVNASRKGKQTYSRFEAADAAMEGIQKRYPGWKIGTASDHQIEFRLDIENNEVIFSLRLTGATFRYRQAQRQFSRAALLPTVAHAMVWLSNPQVSDIFVDPCCGSGTILAERAVYPATRLIGGDISQANVVAAKENLPLSGVRVEWWDARKLPLDSNYVDKIITNLPFGRQISVDEEIASFNHKMVKEMSRVMKKNGTAILLSESGSQILMETERYGFSCLRSIPLSLKGLHPTLIVLEKN